MISRIKSGRTVYAIVLLDGALKSEGVKGNGVMAGGER